MGNYSKAKGRSDGVDRHVRFYHWMLKSEAWESLSPTARSLFIQLRMRFNGLNNGKIGFSQRDAAKEVGVTTNTIHKAFKQLQERGFIKIHKRGAFSLKKRHASEWEITVELMGDKPPTKDFMCWRKK